MADSLESKRSEKKSEHDGVPLPLSWVKSNRRPILGTKVDVDCKGRHTRPCEEQFQKLPEQFFRCTTMPFD